MRQKARAKAAAPAYRVLRDRVLIRRDAPEAHFAPDSALVKPENTQEPPDSGIVLAVGDGRLLASGELSPLVVHVGDRVHFGKHSGKPIWLAREDGVKERLLVMKEDDVLVVEEQER